MNDPIRPPAARSTMTSTPGATSRMAAGWSVPSAPGSPGIPTVTVPPPDAATARSGVPLATSSLTGGVVRKICWSNPTMIPPIVCPSGCPFFFVTPRSLRWHRAAALCGTTPRAARRAPTRSARLRADGAPRRDRRRARRHWSGRPRRPRARGVMARTSLRWRPPRTGPIWPGPGGDGPRCCRGCGPPRSRVARSTSAHPRAGRGRPTGRARAARAGSSGRRAGRASGRSRAPRRS